MVVVVPAHPNVQRARAFTALSVMKVGIGRSVTAHGHILQDPLAKLVSGLPLSMSNAQLANQPIIKESH